MSKQWNELFVQVTKPHWENMLRFAHSLANNSHDAEDIHQTALLKALKAFPSFLAEKNPSHNSNGTKELSPEIFNAQALTEDSHLRNWLMKILKNTWLDSLPLHKRFVLDSDGSLLGNVPVPPPEYKASEILGTSDLQNEESNFWEAALDDDWFAKVNTLNPRQKSTIFLAAHDYSYKEISEILNIPVGTVMSTLSRAVQKLKKPSL